MCHLVSLFQTHVATASCGHFVTKLSGWWSNWKAPASKSPDGCTATDSAWRTSTEPAGGNIQAALGYGPIVKHRQDTDTYHWKGWCDKNNPGQFFSLTPFLCLLMNKTPRLLLPSSATVACKASKSAQQCQGKQGWRHDQAVLRRSNEVNGHFTSEALVLHGFDSTSREHAG